MTDREIVRGASDAAASEILMAAVATTDKLGTPANTRSAAGTRTAERALPIQPENEAQAVTRLKLISRRFQTLLSEAETMRAAADQEDPSLDVLIQDIRSAMWHHEIAETLSEQGSPVSEPGVGFLSGWNQPPAMPNRAPMTGSSTFATPRTIEENSAGVYGIDGDGWDAAEFSNFGRPDSVAPSFVGADDLRGVDEDAGAVCDALAGSVPGVETDAGLAGDAGAAEDGSEVPTPGAQDAADEETLHFDWRAMHDVAPAPATAELPPAPTEEPPSAPTEAQTPASDTSVLDARTPASAFRRGDVVYYDRASTGEREIVQVLAVSGEADTTLYTVQCDRGVAEAAAEELTPLSQHPSRSLSPAQARAAWPAWTTKTPGVGLPSEEDRPGSPLAYTALHTMLESMEREVQRVAAAHQLMDTISGLPRRFASPTFGSRPVSPYAIAATAGGTDSDGRQADDEIFEPLYAPELMRDAEARHETDNLITSMEYAVARLERTAERAAVAAARVDAGDLHPDLITSTRASATAQTAGEAVAVGTAHCLKREPFGVAPPPNDESSFGVAFDDAKGGSSFATHDDGFGAPPADGLNAFSAAFGDADPGFGSGAADFGDGDGAGFGGGGDTGFGGGEDDFGANFADGKAHIAFGPNPDDGWGDTGFQ